MSVHIDRIMKKMPASWRYSWCNQGLACQCIGAANCSGGAAMAGFNKKDWEDWVSRHPETEHEAQASKSPIMTYYTPHLTEVVETQTAEQFFAWQDSLTKEELEAYEEGRMARGARFVIK